MRKILFAILTVLLSVLLALGLTGCKDETPDEPDTPDTPPVVEGYKDPSHKKGTYKVEFVLRGKTVTHFYEAGEMPEAPEVAEEKNGAVLLVFKSWDKEIAPVTGNAEYTAEYTSTTYEYTATFIFGGGRQTKVKAIAGTIAKAPDVPSYRGMEFACWDVAPYATTEDVTYTAVYTGVLTPSALKDAMYHPDWQWHNHGHRDMEAATALYALAFEEHENPQNGPVRDRAIAQLEHLTADGSAPSFTCSTNWAYGITCAAIAMIKDTPSIYDEMSYTLKKKVDTMMEAFMYIISLGTSDHNSYSTGPNFGGNYKNNWNANYALGNIPCMVFGVYYFGDGDINAGAETVNDKLKGFDEAEYDRMVKAFNTYGWQEASKCWTTEAPKEGFSDAKTMLISGGPVCGDDVWNTGTVTGLGNGKGVSGGGRDFTYTNKNAVFHTQDYVGITLYEPEKILKCMADYNYAWKTVSEWDMQGHRAYILDETKSPYEGMDGMMYEFGLSGRSSTDYCGHDFNMIVLHLHAAKVLTRYTTEGGNRAPVTDSFGNEVPLYDFTEDAARWLRIQVGTEDFIYKMIHGYQNQVNTSYGYTNTIGRESATGSGYRITKAIWRTHMRPLGTIAEAESFS